MRFKVEDNLTEAQVQSGLSYVIKDGVASQAMGILTGGAFLVAFKLCYRIISSYRATFPIAATAFDLPCRKDSQ
jgi:hypothetical protein